MAQSHKQLCKDHRNQRGFQPYYNISIADKLRIEGKYHKFTNAGHISYIELDGDPSDNLEAFESVVRIMKESDIGYGAINHPVDRDPVCGYVGIIKDVCPRCGRKTGEPVSVDLLKRLDGKEQVEQYGKI